MPSNSRPAASRARKCDDAGMAVVAEPDERKRCAHEVGCEPFSGGTVACTDALSLVGGKAGAMKAVQDVQGGLADPAAGEIERENRAVGTSFSIRTAAGEAGVDRLSLSA